MMFLFPVSKHVPDADFGLLFSPTEHQHHPVAPCFGMAEVVLQQDQPGGDATHGESCF